MTDKSQQPDAPSPQPGQAQPGGTTGAAKGVPPPLPQPVLRCPFCGGRRFDFGRDVFAGPEQLMYCRKTPPPGQRPEKLISLPMKGAVCLTCGYVAMMVDINQVHTPIRRPGDAAAALARNAGAAAHLARSPTDEAAQALEKMIAGGRTPPAAPSTDVEPAPQPEKVLGEGEEDFPDLGRLIDQAERRLGIGRPARGSASDSPPTSRP